MREQSRATRDSTHPSGQALGDVALLPSIHDLQLVVVAAGGERLPGLGQAHIHDALPFPHILQELRKKHHYEEDR